MHIYTNARDAKMRSGWTARAQRSPLPRPPFGAADQAEAVQAGFVKLGNQNPAQFREFVLVHTCTSKGYIRTAEKHYYSVWAR